MEKITGTLIWYYYICPREVWFISREISPQQDNPYIEIGRIIEEESYKDEMKGFEAPGMKIDLIKVKDRHIIVGEIKKSSKFLEAASMQLLYYLYRLKENGVLAEGELLIPKEKKKKKVSLKKEDEIKLKIAFSEIEKIISNNKPPVFKKLNFCKNCGYKEFCFI